MTNDFELLQELRQSTSLLEIIRNSSANELTLQKRLRSEFHSELIRAALTLCQAREKAAASGKFSHAADLWLDRLGYEQSTAEAVALHKAKRFAEAVHHRTGTKNGTAPDLIWDFCSGIGIDAIALAKQVVENGANDVNIMTVDRNPAACLRTQWNAELYAVGNRVCPIAADVSSIRPDNLLVHIDPDRRAHGQRSIRVEQCEPGLPFLKELTERAAGGAIKLSPASNFTDQLPNVEYELISLNGECKEATLWFGELAKPGIWRATALPSGESISGFPLDAFAEQEPLGRYLYDPDPAVVRSGLIDLLCEQTGLARLDDAEEYLTSDEFIASPFVRAFEVLEELPNNDREIRRAFRRRNFRSVEIKCRHLPINADAVRKRLPLDGSEPCVLFFARINGKSRAIIAHRLN